MKLRTINIYYKTFIIKTFIVNMIAVAICEGLIVIVDKAVYYYFLTEKLLRT